MYFDVLVWSTTFNLGSLLSFSTSKSIYILDLTSISFILIVLWYEVLYLLPVSSNYQYTNLFYYSHVFADFMFKISNKSFSNDRFSFIICWIIFSIIVLQPMFDWCIVKLITFIYQYFGLVYNQTCLKKFEIYKSS